MTFLTWNRDASCEWVSSVASLAIANWGVFGYDASSVKSARSRAGVLTLLVNAGQVSGTFRINCAFWAAVGGSSYIILQTRARGLVTYNPALRIGAAG